MRREFREKNLKEWDELLNAFFNGSFLMDRFLIAALGETKPRLLRS
jgi:hypothetical protein